MKITHITGTIIEIHRTSIVIEVADSAMGSDEDAGKLRPGRCRIAHRVGDRFNVPAKIYYLSTESRYNIDTSEKEFFERVYMSIRKKFMGKISLTSIEIVQERE